MPKFEITTLGCKVNQAESDAIAHDLVSSRWCAVREPEQADVCIVNTCTVTRKASMQSRQAVRKAMRTHPKAQIVVTGCYAQTASQELNAIPGITRIIGHREKQAIGSLILTDQRGADDPAASGQGAVLKEKEFKRVPTAASGSRTRPFLKIQDGCDAFCTYCIVPLARGRSRSMELDWVLRGIQLLAEADYHEVVLTGIHLGAYGRDLSPALDLAALLRRIRASELIDRVRLSSIEPLELTQEIIQMVAESNAFCRHFHIPLQSGDDRILKKMGRPYSRQSCQKLIHKIHELMPDAAIGADILIGFPGENEAAFEHTYEMIENLPLSYLHVFPFSRRPGTAAAEFRDRIPHATIKDRCKQMRRLAQHKRIDFYRKFVGTTLPLLIETRRDAITGLLKGLSSNYLPVLINSTDDAKLNRIIDVKIEKLEGNKLFGKFATLKNGRTSTEMSKI